jgi:ribonuclease-3
MELGDGIVLGQGAENSGERQRSSVLAGAFEAIIAAVYLDQGLEGARVFILTAVAPELEAELPADVLKAPKSRLQECAFATAGQAPSYFVVEVEIAGVILGSGEGRSRREAETHAAEVALEALPAEPTAEADGAAV